MCDKKQENDSHNLEKQEVLCCMTDFCGEIQHTGLLMPGGNPGLKK